MESSAVIILVSPCLPYHLEMLWDSPRDTPPGFTEKRDPTPIEGFAKPVPGPARKEEGFGCFAGYVLLDFVRIVVPVSMELLVLISMTLLLVPETIVADLTFFCTAEYSTRARESISKPSSTTSLSSNYCQWCASRRCASNPAPAKRQRRPKLSYTDSGFAAPALFSVM